MLSKAILPDPRGSPDAHCVSELSLEEVIVNFLTSAVLVIKGLVLNLQTLTSAVFMNFIIKKTASRSHTFTSYNLSCMNKV
jgi:hypothetical protein